MILFIVVSSEMSVSFEGAAWECDVFSKFWRWFCVSWLFLEHSSAIKFLSKGKRSSSFVAAEMMMLRSCRSRLFGFWSLDLLCRRLSVTLSFGSNRFLSGNAVEFDSLLFDWAMAESEFSPSSGKVPSGSCVWFRSGCSVIWADNTVQYIVVGSGSSATGFRL